MKPILIASVVALATPALAQYPTSEPMPPTPPPVTGASPSQEMAPAQEMAPTEMPMTPEEHAKMKKGMKEKAKAKTEAKAKAKTEAETAAPASEMAAPAAPAAEAAPAPATTTAAAPATPPANPTLAHWDFKGDMGKIGTPNWGVGSHMGTGGTSAMGMGGPIDVASQWSSVSPTGAALTPLQFGVWLLDAYGQKVDRPVEATKRGRKANLPAIQVLNVTAGALSEADTNHDWRVSREELMAFAGS